MLSRARGADMSGIPAEGEDAAMLAQGSDALLAGKRKDPPQHEETAAATTATATPEASEATPEELHSVTAGGNHHQTSAGRLALRCSMDSARAYKRQRVEPESQDLEKTEQGEQEYQSAQYDTESDYDEDEDEDEEQSSLPPASSGYFSATELCSSAQESVSAPSFIYSSYGEEGNTNTLGSSGSPPTLSKTPSPMDRDPSSPQFDAWNELFQMYYEMGSSTPEERVQRGGKTYQTYEHFVRTAKEISKTIISEMFLTPQKKSISSSNAGGVGGGEKYCARGIFFKFVRDAYGLYGGDHFSMKAAGHEIKSMNALLQCNIPQLHLPMVTVVDYWGWRVFAEAALPINKYTIVYGSDNGGRHVYDSSTEMRAIMQQAASMLNLKEHIVARNLTTRPKSLFGPCDIEGHRGTDGRFYIVDTARLFPAEGAFSSLYAIKIPANKDQPTSVVHLSAANRKEQLKDVFANLSSRTLPLPSKVTNISSLLSIESLLSPSTELRPPSSPQHSPQHSPRHRSRSSSSSRDEEFIMLERICIEQRFEDSLITLYSLLPEDQWQNGLQDNQTISSEEHQVYEYLKSLPPNDRATCLTGHPIHGDVLVLHATKLQSFFYLLRPELVKSWKKPLSSDAFSNFGVDSAEEHESEVEELTQHLRQVVIPDFVKWASANPERVVSGLHMSPLLHKMGINLRYLGYLYCQFTQERLKYNCVGFQMIARTLKNLLRAKLRAKRGMAEESHRQAIVEFFNLVFGEDERSNSFWEFAMPIHLSLKYGPFCFSFSPTENTNLKFILGKLALFQMLQEYTGVRFNLDSHQARLRFARGGEFLPLTVAELEGMEATVKGVDIRSKILPSISECCPVDSVLPSEAALALSSNSLSLSISSSLDLPLQSPPSSSSLSLSMPAITHSSLLTPSTSPLLSLSLSSSFRSTVVPADAISRAVMLQERYRSLVSSIYSPSSPEMAASTIRLADLYSLSGSPDKAAQMMKECVKCLQGVSEIAGEVLLGCLYLMALIAERDGNNHLAYALYEAILASMLEIYDSTDDPKSASPFEVELRASLVRLLRRQGETSKAEEHQEALQKLLLIFPNALSRHPYHKVLNFLAFKNLSGYNFNPQEMDLQAIAEFLSDDSDRVQDTDST